MTKKGLYSRYFALIFVIKKTTSIGALFFLFVLVGVINLSQHYAMKKPEAQCAGKISYQCQPTDMFEIPNKFDFF